MANTRRNKNQHETKDADEKLEKREIAPVAEVDLDTPEQSIDDAEKKTTESTPLPNTDEQEAKTIELSPIGYATKTTDITSETINTVLTRRGYPSRRDLLLWCIETKR